MSWVCRMIEWSPTMTWDDLQIGDMFSAPQAPEDEHDLHWPFILARRTNLSDLYKQHNDGRRPLMVVLPGRSLFCIDGKCRNSQGSYGGWTVTGSAPDITVFPSINLGGVYHGWLQNGIISDDVEGRTFSTQGYEWDLD